MRQPHNTAIEAGFRLNADWAERVARVALANVQQEYPNKLDHVMNHAGEVQSPRTLHPVFYGSYDWHSSVHMHWSLVRLLRQYPNLTAVPEILSHFASHFRPENVAVECAYLQQKSRANFERTYGWAWLLKLQQELGKAAIQSESPHANAFKTAHVALLPLADIFCQAYHEFLPTTHYPIRAGTHANSAFGLLLALDYAQSADAKVRHPTLENVLCQKARAWFAADKNYPAQYEPGGDDFLSGGLLEALLMSRVLTPKEFAVWWQGFAPAELSPWYLPAQAGNRADPKLSHLDGLNLSRAWCWRGLLPFMDASLQETIHSAIARHLQAGLPHVLEGEYAGTHWLTSFALLAL